jgi:hypothetical protein
MRVTGAYQTAPFRSAAATARGTFSATFLLACLFVLETEVMRLEDL